MMVGISGSTGIWYVRCDGFLQAEEKNEYAVAAVHSAQRSHIRINLFSVSCNRRSISCFLCARFTHLFLRLLDLHNPVSSAPL